MPIEPPYGRDHAEHDAAAARASQLPPPPPPTANVAVARRPPIWVTAAVAAAVAATTSLGVAAMSPTGSAAGDEPARTSQSSVTTTSAAPDDGPGAATSQGSGLTVAEVSERVLPSVASVASLVAGAGPGGADATRAGTGSAVLLTDDGYLLTNNHVVEGASEVRVTLADGTTHEATLVGTDATSDLAVLHIDATGLPAATFADDLPQVGSTAIAMGSPFGLDGSITAGIVSALDRSLAAGGSTITGMIQTDAAINPGNSGGPLVDDAGRVIGINTAIYSRSGANDGVGFAVPATTATVVADQLIAGEPVTWPVLGIMGQDIDAAVAQAYELPTEQGALVAEVAPDSGAADAGLADGDIIVALDDTTVASMSELAAAVRTHDVGDTVTVTVLRDSEQLELDVTLTAG